MTSIMPDYSIKTKTRVFCELVASTWRLAHGCACERALTGLLPFGWSAGFVLGPCLSILVSMHALCPIWSRRRAIGMPYRKGFEPMPASMPSHICGQEPNSKEHSIIILLGTGMPWHINSNSHHCSRTIAPNNGISQCYYRYLLFHIALPRSN